MLKHKQIQEKIKLLEIAIENENMGEAENYFDELFDKDEYSTDILIRLLYSASKLGQRYKNIPSNRKATFYYKKVFELFIKLDNILILGDSEQDNLIKIIVAQRIEKQYEKGLYNLKLMLEQANTLSSSQYGSLLQQSHAFAAHLLQQERTQEAEELYATCITQGIAKLSLLEKINFYSNAGHVFLQHNEWETAVPYFTEALNLLEQYPIKEQPAYSKTAILAQLKVIQSSITQCEQCVRYQQLHRFLEGQLNRASQLEGKKTYNAIAQHILNQGAQLERYHCFEEADKLYGLVVEYRKDLAARFDLTAINKARVHNNQCQREKNSLSAPEYYNTLGLEWRKKLHDLRKKFESRINKPATLIESQSTYTRDMCVLLTEMLNNISSFLGKAPCDFEILLTGSASRDELGPFSDLDPAILVADGSKRDHRYFKILMYLWRFHLSCLGDPWILCDGNKLFIGLHIDEGDIKKLLEEESPLINTPEAMATYVTESFCDSREEPILQYALMWPISLYTNRERGKSLLKEYQCCLIDQLQLEASNSAEKNHQKVAVACLEIHPKKFSNIQILYNGWDTLDIKACFIAPLTYWCLDLGLYFGVTENNTLIANIPKLVIRLKDNKHIEAELAEKIIQAWESLHKLRCQCQFARRGQPDEVLYEGIFWNVPPVKNSSSRDPRRLPQDLLPVLNFEQLQLLKRIQDSLLQPIYDNIPTLFTPSTPTTKQTFREMKEEKNNMENMGSALKAAAVPFATYGASTAIGYIANNLRQPVQRSLVDRILGRQPQGWQVPYNNIIEVGQAQALMAATNYINNIAEEILSRISSEDQKKANANNESENLTYEKIEKDLKVILAHLPELANATASTPMAINPETLMLLTEKYIDIYKNLFTSHYSQPALNAIYFLDGQMYALERLKNLKNRKANTYFYTCAKAFLAIEDHINENILKYAPKELKNSNNVRLYVIQSYIAHIIINRKLEDYLVFEDENLSYLEYYYYKTSKTAPLLEWIKKKTSDYINMWRLVKTTDSRKIDLLNDMVRKIEACIGDDLQKVLTLEKINELESIVIQAKKEHNDLIKENNYRSSGYAGPVFDDILQAISSIKRIFIEDMQLLQQIFKHDNGADLYIDVMQCLKTRWDVPLDKALKELDEKKNNDVSKVLKDISPQDELTMLTRSPIKVIRIFESELLRLGEDGDKVDEYNRLQEKLDRFRLYQAELKKREQEYWENRHAAENNKTNVKDNTATQESHHGEAPIKTDEAKEKETETSFPTPPVDIKMNIPPMGISPHYSFLSSFIEPIPVTPSACTVILLDTSIQITINRARDEEEKEKEKDNNFSLKALKAWLYGVMGNSGLDINIHENRLIISDYGFEKKEAILRRMQEFGFCLDTPKTEATSKLTMNASNSG